MTPEEGFAELLKEMRKKHLGVFEQWTRAKEFLRPLSLEHRCRIYHSWPFLEWRKAFQDPIEDVDKELAWKGLDYLEHHVPKLKEKWEDDPVRLQFLDYFYALKQKQENP